MAEEKQLRVGILGGWDIARKAYYPLLPDWPGVDVVGAFPLWLSPVQVVMVPIADRHIPYAQEVAEKLKAEGFRAEVDDSSDRMGAKIRYHTTQKIPYMCVIGDREMEAGEIAPRTRAGEDLGAMPVKALIQRLQKDVEEGV